jgi:hypothetical protein
MTMSDWFNIRIKTEKENFNAVRTKIIDWPDQVMDTVYESRIDAITDNAVEYFRGIIDNSPTMTGEARGAVGRNKTGKMRKNVSGRARKRAASMSVFVGWQRGVPGYAIFQEQGTDGGGEKKDGSGVRKGIQAMNAVEQTGEYILAQLLLLPGARVSSMSNPRFNEGEGDGN